MRSKVFENVEELIEDTFGKNSDTSAEIKSCVNDMLISRKLCVLRHLAGFTEQDIAKKMGIEEEEVSRIENAYSGEITLDEIAGFVNACGYDLFIGANKGEPTIKEKLDFHSEGLLEIFQEMRDICKDDYKMLAEAVKMKANISIDVVFECLKTVAKMLESEEKQPKVKYFFPGQDGDIKIYPSTEKKFALKENVCQNSSIED